MPLFPPSADHPAAHAGLETHCQPTVTLQNDTDNDSDQALQCHHLGILGQWTAPQVPQGKPVSSPASDSWDPLLTSPQPWLPGRTVCKDYFAPLREHRKS